MPTESAAPPRGHNAPPEVNPLLERLGRTYEGLLDEIADHELAASALPRSVETEEQAAEVNAWVAKARALYKRAEDARKTEKEDYLNGGRAIDLFFKTPADDLTARAKRVTERLTPFLAAKRAEEEAKRAAAAAEAKRKEDEARAAAERARQEAIAKQRAAEEAERLIREAKDAEAREKAAAVAREAFARAQEAQAAETKRADEAAKATRAADRAEAKASSTKPMERTTGGGAAAKLKTVREATVTDLGAFTASLGPLGPWLPSDDLLAALHRAAQHHTWPSIPGVVFFEREEAAIHATRAATSF